MSSEEDREAEAIASDWGIDVSLLDGVDWTIDTINGNDGEVYGYIANFDKGTDKNILSALGLAPGEFTRRISLNAFDQPDEEEASGRGPYGTAPRDRETDDHDASNDDDGIYSVEEPLPDISDFIYEEELPELPPGEEYLTDETGEVLTDEEGNPLVVGVSTDSASDTAQAQAPAPDSLGKLTGAAFAGDAFAGHAFATADDASTQQERADSLEEGVTPLHEAFFNSDLFDFALPETPSRPKDIRRAYYLDEKRITPSQFRRLGKRRKVEVMVQWFHENYEDPAVRTPYESAEGGYQWIWGGPHDAREEISDQFADLVDEDDIEAAVQEIEEDGLVEWAPKESPDDYDPPEELNDEPPIEGSLADIMGSNFGNASFSNLVFDPGAVASPRGQDGTVEALKVEMLNRLDSLEALIRQQMSIAPNRGHNHPPELLEAELPVSQAQYRELAVAIAEVREQSANPAPQLLKVVENASLLRRIADSVKLSPGFIFGAAASGIIGDLAVDAFKSHRHQIYEALVQASDAVMAWANYLLPF